MTLRISFIVPLLLAVSTIVSSSWIYFDSKLVAEKNIREEVLSQVKLDVTRLQNVLYNLLTEKDNSFQDARLNLSVTAMDPLIRTLLLTDGNNKVILANRYSIEGERASIAVKDYDRAIAQQITSQNTPVVKFLENNDSILHGYYPVILKLENSDAEPGKHVGVLFIEVNIASKLNREFVLAANRSMELAGFMLVVSLLVAYLLHKLITRRLSLLSRASEKLAAGQLDTQVNLKGRDELAQLGDAFDEMALKIKEGFSQKEAAEIELRELNNTLEQRISERTMLLQEAQSIGHLGNWSWDVTNDRHYWSEELYRIFGFQPGGIKPTHAHLMSAIHPDDLEWVKEAEEEAFSRGERLSIDHRIILPGGDIRWVHEDAITELDIKGQPVSMTGIVQDITERKLIETNLIAAKEEAEYLNESKSIFLSRMSHELRTPLNAIIGFAQILQLDQISEKQNEFANEIKDAGDHLLALISELLDLSSIEAGRIMVVMESVSLEEVINEASKITHNLITENNLNFIIQCETGDKVIADNIRLRQVLVNLISNAAKYNRQGGTIMIKCESREETIRIMVTDTGMGIAPENLQKLFTPFERMGAEHSGIDGTGIGLALSKQLVELMNGSIGVESAAGKGSTFWFELPRAKKINLHTNQPDHTQLDISSNLRILYIEDNLANIRVAEALLGHFDQIKLITANSGNYGIELAKEYLPDVILLDIKLPDISGYQVLNVLRHTEVTKEIPIIALSADALPIDIERGMKAGFDSYLTKPIELDKLIESLNKFGNRKI